MKETASTTSSEIENTQGEDDSQIFEGTDPTKKIKQPKPIRFPESEWEMKCMRFHFLNHLFYFSSRELPFSLITLQVSNRK